MTVPQFRIGKLPTKITHYTHAKGYSIFKGQQNARTDLENDWIESP